MPSSTVRPEVLALGVHRGTVAALLRAARQAGAIGFSVQDAASARTRFLRRGNLHVLVIAPDVSPVVADAVARAVWAVDAGVDIVVFGRELLRAPAHQRVHRIVELHPTSRAGLGALRRHVTACWTPEHG